jgi:hypothetical protein
MFKLQQAQMSVTVSVECCGATTVLQMQHVRADMMSASSTITIKNKKRGVSKRVGCTT